MMRKICAGALVIASTTGWTAAQPFSFEYLRSDLVPTVFGSVSWADADLDGKLDVVITGSTTHEQPYEPTTTLYLQGSRTGTDGTGRQHFEARELPGLWHSASAWNDVDRDGDADLVILGAAGADQPYEGQTLLLANDGKGNFSDVHAGLPGLYAGSADWGDYDNDGDADLLLTGLDGDQFVTALMRNENGSFSQVDVGLVNVGYGSARFGDFDRDRDLDIILTGQSDNGYLTEIYRNDRGSFTPFGLPSLHGLVFSSAAWGDVDADGDLDILLTGGELGEHLYTGHTRLLINQNNAVFTGQDLEEPGMLGGAVAWGDINLDGMPDGIASGAYYPSGPRATRVYFNTGGGLDAAANLPGALFSKLALGDYDRDGDLDLVMTGLGGLGTDITNLYVNSQRVVNDPPVPPSGLNASVEGDRVNLTWEPSPDDHAGPLTYNLRVATSASGIDIVAPAADPATGVRFIEGAGNVHQNRSWMLEGLPPGTYFWSVQAVDAAFAGSAFSTTGSFTVAAE